MKAKLYQDITIGDNLRVCRETAGYTQEQAAEQLVHMGLPVCREVISQIELGNHHIKISLLCALKEIYRVKSFDDFFGGIKMEEWRG